MKKNWRNWILEMRECLRDFSRLETQFHCEAIGWQIRLGP
jgi:hypothetical protein